MDLLDHHARVPEHVVYRSFGSETIVLNLDTGTYHGFEPPGDRFLEIMEDHESLAAAAAAIASEFEQPLERVETDLRDFVTALVDRGLLVIDAVPGR